MDFKKEDVIPKDFYNFPPEIVAPKLLGKYLVRKIENNFLIGKIVETEAYMPSNDPAAHSSRGKDLRNEMLYGDAGHAYVHSIHKYHCVDIVCEGKDIPGSVLIRALEPIMGTEIMMQNRNASNSDNITNGPGKLCQSLKIDLKLNGVDVTKLESELFVVDLDKKEINKNEIKISGRIGISKAKDEPLRFSIKENPFVSK